MAAFPPFSMLFTSNIFAQRFQELMVGIGKLWVEEALYVDHGGGGAGVSQSLGDKSHVEVVLIGNARPSVSHHIGGKGLAGRDALRQARQVVVVATKLVLVLPMCQYCIGRIDDGKNIRSIAVSLILSDNLVHTRFYRHHYLLSCFVAGIVKSSVSDLFLSQIGNIYERHSHGIKTEEEYVASKSKRWLVFEIEVAQPQNVLFLCTAFASMFLPSEHFAERLRVGSHLQGYTSII